LRARRARLAAEVAERRGDGGAGASAAAAKADSALGRRDWATAALLLRRHLDARLPAGSAPLAREHRDAALRLAAALTLAGDEAALAALRERVADRMGEGPQAEAFARLAAPR
jgi:hypothetical protein